MSLPIKDPNERILVVFDLSNLCSTATNAVVEVVHYSGAADNSPDSMLDGNPETTVNKVQQWIIGGITGANYKVRCSFDTETEEHLVVSAVLQVMAK